MSKQGARVALGLAAAIFSCGALAANTPGEFASFVRTEVAKWAKVIRDANVSLN